MDTAVNFFEAHIENFRRAAGTIGRRCVEFDGRTDNLEAYAFEQFRRVFSHGGDRVLTFDCAVRPYRLDIRCVARVDAEGNLTISMDDS